MCGACVVHVWCMYGASVLRVCCVYGMCGVLYSKKCAWSTVLLFLKGGCSFR